LKIKIISYLEKNYYEDGIEIEKILEYSESVYLLFNSPVIDELLFDGRIFAVDNGKNIGISRAINRGINKAAQDGYCHALLFDQDSYMTADQCVRLFNEITAEEKHQKVACIGPSINSHGNMLPIPAWSKNTVKIHTENVVSVNNLITFGMLINIPAFFDIGGFPENFPVDFSDFLFCWKAVYRGYIVLQSTDAYIIHEIGTNFVKIFGQTIHFHAPYRNYFLVRDTLNICFRVEETPLYIRFRYFFFLPFRMLLFFVMLDNKWTRLKMYWLGIIDFFMGKSHFGSIDKVLGAK
jgi:rhamnosyltransferase